MVCGLNRRAKPEIIQYLRANFTISPIVGEDGGVIEFKI